MASKDSFKIGDFVVYPAHGVGRIISIGNHDVCGTEVELFVIDFRSDHMTLKLPVQKACSSGLRHVCGKEEMESALEALSTKSKKKKIVWSRRAQEYETKINSGSVCSLADVIRELHSCQVAGDQSYSERQIYKIAMDRFIKELSIVEDIAEDEAFDKVRNILLSA
jgi:CarD family transcriptional regulator